MGNSEWAPVVYGAPLCGHGVYSPRAGGWVIDCDDRAVFVRTKEYGGHEYACAAHVASFDESEAED